MEKKKILAVGEIIWDVYPDKSVIGGAPLNFVSHASLCGAGSALVSAVGDDSLGEKAIEILGSFGVGCQFVKTVQAPTGQCLVTLDERGVPNYNVLRGVAYDNIKLDGADIERINTEGYDAFYFGTLIQREPVSRDTVKRIVDKCRFEHIICDVNLRKDCFDAESVELCLKSASILKISDEEEPTLRSFGFYTPKDDTLGGIARAICERFPNVKVVIITRGAQGSYAFDARSGREYSQAPIGDNVVSTVGAGDSFAAAWTVSFLNGDPIETCMQNAAKLSGFVVAHTEAVPRY